LNLSRADIAKNRWSSTVMTNHDFVIVRSESPITLAVRRFRPAGLAIQHVTTPGCIASSHAKRPQAVLDDQRNRLGTLSLVTSGIQSLPSLRTMDIVD